MWPLLGFKNIIVGHSTLSHGSRLSKKTDCTPIFLSQVIVVR